MTAFAEAFRPKRTLLVGGDGIATEEFLARPATPVCVQRTGRQRGRQVHADRRSGPLACGEPLTVIDNCLQLEAVA